MADPSCTVCTCMAVTQGDIVGAIGALGLRTVGAVGEHTRADIEALLERQHPQPIKEAQAA